MGKRRRKKRKRDAPDECENCYQYARCIERRGHCTQYRSLEDIRKEIEAIGRG